MQTRPRISSKVSLAIITVVWLGAFVFLSVPLAPFAQGADAAAKPDWEPVLKLLEARCVKCHGGGKRLEGNLSLLTREDILRGGDAGEAIVPGKPENSYLYKLITHAEEPAMPENEDKLPAVEIAKIGAWISAGAPYPRKLAKPSSQPEAAPVGEFAITEKHRQHWSFLPVKRPELPAVKQAGWAKQPFDKFILAALESRGLSPANPATREQLIRRVSFDLIGLPPTPAEIDAFVADESPDAYEKLIDRLLASPHYGERWGRHWLDLARYAETDGFEHDAVRPHAYRYRDYVIRSLNADKPYDRFVLEQLAGDELFPDDADAVQATAFNLLGPDMVDSADQLQRKHNTLNDMTDATSLAFLGLTMGCARCHDHKFEPIAQKDYYRLQAFFTPANFQRELTAASPTEKQAFASAMKEYNARTKLQQDEIVALEAPYRQKLLDKKLAALSEEAQLAHRTPPEKRTTEQNNQVQETAAMAKYTEKELVASMPPSEQDRHKQLVEELKKTPKPASLPQTMALQRTPGTPAKTFLLVRGDPGSKGDEVPAGFPTVLVSKTSPATISTSTGAAISGRASLARWVANENNPLTARVIVNRLWFHHFGRGIVATPSDFGVRGAKPTHPELLDWLASEFMARGWKFKTLHKQILLSATYQQSSHASPEALKLDPENQLFSHRDRLRLEGEVIRDSLLAISGQLNLELGGPSVQPPIPSDILKGSTGWRASNKPSEYNRRSIYIFARRNLRFPFLEVFDAPDNNLSCAGRERSTSAPQSLTLLNANEVMLAAKAIAKRVQEQTKSRDEQISLAFRLILGRLPSEKELASSREFTAESPFTELCRALLNLNAFVYVE